jgi:HK97 family phage prohead protease
MDFPADLFVKPVKDHDDLIAFQYDFVLDGKALEEGTEQTVTELDNGDLIIEGYAAVFDGLDRQNENFAEGAFQRGIKSFLSGQSALCYHHKHDQCLGKVIDLQEEEGKGLKMKARVDGAIRNHPTLGTYYQQIKNGTLNALSVGGFFKRALTKAGKKIVDMDFTEISVTPVPVHPGTSFNVVAGKALVSDLKPEKVELPNFPEGEIREEDFEMATVAINILDGLFARLEKRGEEQSTSGAVTTI